MASGGSYTWRSADSQQKSDTALTAPPFFDNVYRGEACTWGVKKEGPLVVNWMGLG